MMEGRLGSATLTPGVETLVYTVPAGMYAWIGEIRCCNQNAQQVKWRVAIGTGAAPQATDFVDYDTVCTDRGIVIDDKICLSEGESIWCISDFSGVSSNVFGFERSTGAASVLPPSLDLPFAKRRTSDPRLAVVRASVATYFDATGVLQTAPANTARINYDTATLACRGLLIEESRANLVRNNTMQGAISGTPGTLPNFWAAWTNATGIARQIVGSGVDSGIEYVDIRIFGTPTAAGVYDVHFDVYPSVANGQTLALSCFAQASNSVGVGGYYLNCAELLSGVVLFEAVKSVPVTSAPLKTQRISTANIIGTPATTALPYFRTVLTGAPVDFTLRLGLPQYELGSFATMPIKTAGVIASRAADVVSLATSAAWLNQAEGTLLAEFDSADAPAGAWPRAVCLSDGTANNQIQVVQNGGGNSVFGEITSAGAQTFGSNGFSSYTGAFARVAMGWAANNAAIAKDGAINAVDNTITVPSGLTKLSIGADHVANSGTFLNGHIARLSIWRTRLPDATLQALSSTGAQTPTAGRFGSAVLTPNADTCMHTATAGKTCAVSVRFCNQSTSPVRVSSAFVAGSGMPLASDYISKDRYVPPNGILDDFCIPIQGGLSVFARADSANVSVRVHGLES